MVSTVATHAGDPGSVPGESNFFELSKRTYESKLYVELLEIFIRKKQSPEFIKRKPISWIHDQESQKSLGFAYGCHVTRTYMDWKIQTDLTCVKTIQYDAVGGVLDCFYTCEEA